MRATPLLLLLLATTAAAENSTPQPVPIAETIPAARDIPYPGTLRLEVDASDTRRAIIAVKETIPVAAPGRLTLLYPKWLPGNHAPSGPIEKLAGLGFAAAGRPLAWIRDPVDVFAFHVEVPAGVKAIEARFQFLAATAGDQGRITMTDDMLNLQWNSVVLAPAGHFARAITIDASATYPEGWTSASALRTSAPLKGAVAYPTVSLDTLIDSPVFAGRHARIETLDRDVTLAIFADRPAQLAAATPDRLQLHRNLVVQADRLFGARHFDRYTFLYALSDQLGRVGLEHHRSSENGVPASYFTDWDLGLGNRDLLPHEYTHSWNGKYRRPADLWTPDYRTPMQGSLLWVYEGQTQYWGAVLAARAGLMSLDDALGSLAAVAAQYDTRAGRRWRPLADTTNDPVIAERRPQAWISWQRSEDYYQEGQLLWLDADQLIRERSKGRRSLDDFAKAFFGGRPGDWGELTYTRADVIAALNAVEPYDWATFLAERVDRLRPRAPLGWLDRAGYRLAYTDTPTNWWTTSEKARKRLDLSYSLGLTIGKEGAVTGVIWDGPAFDAGLTVGTTLVAIDGRAYTDESLKDAIVAAKAGAPIGLLVKQDDRYRDVSIKWTGGLRYPRLEKVGKGPSMLEALYAARR